MSSDNLAIEETLRLCTPIENNRNKNHFPTLSKVDRVWFWEKSEKRETLSDEMIEGLRSDDFEISGKDILKVRKYFDSEEEAYEGYYDYEKKVYGDFAYNPLRDMRGFANMYIRMKVIGDVTQDEISREILKSINKHSDAAKVIARYQLKEEYIRLGVKKP